MTRSIPSARTRTEAAASRSSAPLFPARRQSLGLLCCLALCCLLSLLPSATAQASNTNPSLIFPTAVSGGYKDAEMVDATAFPRMGVVLSPAALVGLVAYAPAPFSGPMFRNASCTGAVGEDCRVSYQLQLLNSLDNQYGCATVNRSMHNVTDGGELINERSMMLVERSPPGYCNFGTKSMNVQTTGAGAIMHHGCNPAPPTSCRSGLSITYSHLNISIPCPYMQWFDAMRMKNYLQGRNLWLRAQANRNFSMSSTGAAGPSGFESSSTGPAEPACNCSCAGGNTPTPTPGPEVFTDFTEPLIISFAATGPMIAQDRAALFAIVNNLQTADPVNGVNDALMVGDGGWTSLRGWSEITSHPERDPCMDRIVGMWCENGRLTSVYMFGVNGPTFAGAVDPAWGNLTGLRGVELSNNNFQGALPLDLCALTRLEVFGMDRESDGVHVNVRQGITQLPECIGNLPLIFLSLSTNKVQNFPASLSSANGLRVLILDHNELTLLPTDFSTNLIGLYQLDITFNTALGGPPPSFKGWANVSYLQAHHCGFTGGLTGGNDAFNGMSILTEFDISFNAITGALPIFDGCTMLQIIALNDNQFSGSIPVEWAELDTVTSVKVQNNAIIAPVRALGGMVSLTSLDISNNSLRLPASYNNDAGQFLADMAPNGIITLIADHNEIAGVWSGGLMSSARVIDTLSFAYNKIQKLPQDMWTYSVVHWDASYNALTGDLPPNNPLFATSVALQGNPGLNIWPLPNWLVETLERSATPGSAYSCTVLDSPIIKNFHITVDAASRQFHGCSCIPGSFGRPPLCDAVPERATVNPQDGFSSAEIGPNFIDMISADSASNDADDSGSPSSPGSLQPNTTSPTMALPAGFSDDWYGNQRLTLGVATTWFVNLMDIFHDTAGPKNATYPANELLPMADGLTIKPTKGVDIVQLMDANGNATQVASINIPPSARFQPVRMIRMCIHISRALFTKPSDALTVYEGDPSFSGDRVANLLGTDSFPDPPPYPPLPGTSDADLSITQTPEYQARYAVSMADIQNRSLVELVVKSNAASLHFTSRATEGAHFFATYTYVFSCEPLTRYYLNPVTNMCHEQLPRYPLATSIRHAVFSVAGWSLGWILINVVAIVYKWHSPLYRAASRQFMLLTLGMLALMSFGAMLYAAVPNVWVSPLDGITPVSDGASRALCVGRAWLSCVPLAGILGVLLAKTNRVHNIFGSMTLLKAKSVSDGAIFKSVGALLLVESVFLLSFSLIPLSRPDMRPGIGGSLENYLVLSCSLESGAYVWIGIQIAFFATLMIAAGVMAFRTRNLPSAFNESAHISNCVTVLIFFGCILVPLVLYVHQQPEAAILLQGLGQALLVLLLTTILFAPKLYTAFTTTFQQQKAMMNDERTSGTGTKLGGSGGAASPGGRIASYAPPASLDAPERMTPNPARNISSAKRPSGMGGAMVASSSSPRNYPRTSIRPVMPRTVGAMASSSSSHQGGIHPGLLSATPQMMTPSTSVGGTVHPALELKTGMLPPGAGSSSTPPDSPVGRSRPRDVSTVPEAPEEPASAAGIEARMEQEAASAMAEREPEDADAAADADDRRESDPPPPPPPEGDRVDRY